MGRASGLSEGDKVQRWRPRLRPAGGRVAGCHRAVLISPVGEWIIKGIGWVSLGLGVLVIVLTIVGWLTGGRRREP